MGATSEERAQPGVDMIGKGERGKLEKERLVPGNIKGF